MASFIVYIIWKCWNYKWNYILWSWKYCHKCSELKLYWAWNINSSWWCPVGHVLLVWEYEAIFFTNVFFLFQLYKGEDTSFQISGLQNNTDYRFRVYVCRRCQDSTQELCGPLSPSSLFTLRRTELTLPGELNSPETLKPSGMFATDERFAAVLVGAFAALSFLIAFVVEYFFMKWKYRNEHRTSSQPRKKKNILRNTRTLKVYIRRDVL